MTDHHPETVFIVDDDLALAESLGALVGPIGLQHRLFQSADDFLNAYESGMRGCVVLDIRMPGTSGTRLFQVMKSRGYSIPILFLTAYGDVPMAIQAIRQGAADFLIKPVDPSLFCTSILDAIKLDVHLRAAFETRKVAGQLLDPLNQSEAEVLNLVIDGLSSKEIASKLQIPSSTVDHHRASLMWKFGASNATELVRIALVARDHAMNGAKSPAN